MWRSRSLAEWERKKSYLVRSLFEDIPILSPILEAHEPTSPSSPSHYIYRPESPLPELIIEIEPKKPNLHDEPAELYDQLAKEMRRLYRKDFLDIELSTSSSENFSSESLNRGRIYDNSMSDESDSENVLAENVLKNRYQIDYDATGHQKENDIASPTQTEIRISTESSESIDIASKSVIVQVDIHSQEYEIQEELACEQQGFKESNQYIQSGENSINVSKTTTVIETIEVGDDSTDKEERSDSYRFAKDTDASSSDSNSNSDNSVKSSHASPEIMREKQLFESLETPPYRPVSKSNSTVSNTVHLSMEVDSKEFSEDVLTSNQEIEIAEGSGNETLLFATSTPTRKRTSRSSTKRRHKRRLVSYSSSSSFVSATNAALQTSFSHCETDASFFWSNFFVGMPTIYNICSCNNHVCT